MIYLRIILKLISVELLFCNSLVQAQLGKQLVKTSINKFEQYINSDIDTSYYFLKKAYKESLLLKNNELIAESLYNFGKYYYVRDNFYKAEEHLKKPEQFAVKTNAKEVLSSIYNLQGLVKYVNGQNVEALKLYHKAYTLAEKSDLYENQSKILINLAGLYLSQKDTTGYLETLNKFVDLGSRAGAPTGARCWSRLGEPDEIFEASPASEGRLIRWGFTDYQLVLYFVDETGFGRFRLSPASRAELERVIARLSRQAD